jgi:hypothetical protein
MDDAQSSQSFYFYFFIWLRLYDRNGISNGFQSMTGQCLFVLDTTHGQLVVLEAQPVFLLPHVVMP